MSSKAVRFLRNSFVGNAAIAGIAIGSALFPLQIAAQEQPQTQGSEPYDIEDAPDPYAEDDAGQGSDDRINVLITVPRNPASEAQVKACADDVDAAQISGAIIVCRDIGQDPDNLFSSSRKKARDRYARETAFRDDPAPVDVAGQGIFRGSATVSGACLIPPCPGDPALIIDVEALPQAPEGSDADRIARGLPPLGRSEATEDEIRQRREALGLELPPSESKPD